jgi:hypothetical protein
MLMPVAYITPLNADSTPLGDGTSQTQKKKLSVGYCGLDV